MDANKMIFAKLQGDLGFKRNGKPNNTIKQQQLSVYRLKPKFQSVSKASYPFRY